MQAIYWYLLLEIFRDISSILIRFLQMIIQKILQIRTMVSLYSIFISEAEKTKCILNPFSWSNCNGCYAFIWTCVTNHVPLFEHVSPIEVSWVW